MISNLAKRTPHLLKNSQRVAQRTFRPVMPNNNCNLVTPMSLRTYYQNNVLMQREYRDGYFACPVATAERVIRIIALHDNCKDPSSLQLSLSFEEAGLNDLDMCEVFMMLEKEFDFEISEDDCESMTTLNDIVEFVARQFYAK